MPYPCDNVTGHLGDISRLDQKEISALLAILLGITAIVAHKRGFVTAVIGVGISVALVPPGVVIGITRVLFPDRIIDALSLTLNNVFGLFVGMLIAILVLGVGTLGATKMKLTRRCVYIMTATISDPAPGHLSHPHNYPS